MPDETVQPEKQQKKTEFGYQEPESSDPNLDAAVDEAREIVDDKLVQPGGLEVEEMPESNELVERRRRTKDKLRELANVDDSAERSEPLFQEETNPLLDMLRDANLSPKHLKFCCSGVFLIAILIALIWGVVNWIGSPDSESEVVDEAPIESEDITDRDEPSDLDDFADPSVFSGVLLGQILADTDFGTKVGEDIGDELTEDDGLSKMISDFAQMYEVMNVDVRELLDSSNDRREALNDYLHELNYLAYTGKNNLEKLEADSDNLIQKYSVAEDNRDLYEARFFEKLRDLDAYGSTAVLNQFIDSAEEIVRLRAEYQAREKLIEYYDALLLDMELRAQDIELNEEALVKGIQVVDIQGSDIDLIIEESEL